MIQEYMVFDIGGSAVKWAVIDGTGKIKEKESIKIAKTVKTFFQDLSEISKKMKKIYNLAGIAISAPGAVDSDTGVIGGFSAIPYIHGPDFKKELKKRTGLMVEIENDANCAALGECWLGAGKANKDMAFIVCGSGIGGAIIKDRKIHAGIHKHGGEFGYCPLDCSFDEEGIPYFSSWSQMGSTRGLAERVAERKGLVKDELDGLAVFSLSAQGDKIAKQETNKYYWYMAMGIYTIQYMYDPEVILLGGAISERLEYIDEINERLEYMMKSLSGLEGKIKPVIKRCVYGNDANKLGALYNYLQRQQLEL